MRLQRLDLIAFGPFSGYSLDFSQGNEGLHLVYGPNEAGKSSALRAVRQLLYGIPTRSGDNFVHAHKDLRIGGYIETDGNGLEFIRRKGRAKTLRDKNDDAEIPDEQLFEILGGVDEDTFRTVFGLHHEELVKGGNAIVEGKGNVGEALFAAASGLSSLRDVSESLINESGKLYKPSGSTPRINSTLKLLKDMRKLQKETLLKPDAWSKIHKSLLSARDEREEMEQSIQKINTRIKHLQRVHSAIPLLVERLDARAKLEPVENAVQLPEDFRDKRLALSSNRVNAQSAIEELSTTVVEIEKTLAELKFDDELLACSAHIETLKNKSISNTKALEDVRDTLDPERQLLEVDAKRILSQFNPELELKDADSLRLPIGLQERIESLGASREAIEHRRDEAISRHQSLQIEYEKKLRSLEKLDPPVDFRKLDAFVRSVKENGKLEEQLEELEEKNRVTIAELQARLARNGLWSGSLEDLASLATPLDTTIGQFIDTMDEHRQKKQILTHQIDEVNTRIEETSKQREELQRGKAIPSEKELDVDRERRVIGWQSVRGAWENRIPPQEALTESLEKTLKDAGASISEGQNLADVYEGLTRAADNTVDSLRTDANVVAQVHQLKEVESQNRRKKDGLVEELSVLNADSVEFEKEWETCWETCKITPLSPKEMLEWSRRKEQIVSDIADVNKDVERAKVMCNTIEKYKDEIVVEFKSVIGFEFNRDGYLAEMLNEAESKIEELREAATMFAELSDESIALSEDHIPTAQAHLELMTEEDDKWNSNWAECMVKLGAPPDVGYQEANAMLRKLQELFQKIEKIAELELRINQIKEDDTNFSNAVSKLTLQIAPELQEMPPGQAIRELSERLRRGEDDSLRAQETSERLEIEQRRLKDAQAKLRSSENELHQMCVEARVDDLTELPDCEEQSKERHRQSSRLENTEAQLLRLCLGGTLDAFIESVMKEEADQVTPELERLERETSELDSQLQEKLVDIGSLENELKQMDGNSASAEAAVEAESLLASLNDDSENYIQLRLASLVLERAIEQYREKNQGPILSRAGEIFSDLTLGSFEDLRADFGEDGESVLFGIRRESRQLVDVSGMSDGTADQLYLALRLASLEQIVEQKRPIPFILDDILINFDDDRSAATLKTLTEISKRTQVIFFTHHQHLLDVARKAVPEKELFVHTME